MHREASKLANKEEIRPKQKMSKNMLKDKDFLDSIQKLVDKPQEEATPAKEKPSISVCRLYEE